MSVTRVQKSVPVGAVKVLEPPVQPRTAPPDRRGSGRVTPRGWTPDGDQPKPLRVVDGVLPHAEASLPGLPGAAHRLRHAGLLQVGRRRDSARAGRVRELRRAAGPEGELLRAARGQAAGRGLGVRLAVDGQEGRRGKEGEVPADGGAGVLAGGSGGRLSRPAGAGFSTA